MVHYQNDGTTVEDITGYGYDMDFYNLDTHFLIKSTSVSGGEITLTDPINGEFEVNAGSTLAWPIGKMAIDLKVTPLVGEVAHTETFYINVQAGISQ